jgi:hypothetical protein
MRRHLTAALVTISLLFGSSAVPRSAVCVSAGPGQLRCTISKLSDCEEIHDYPYARDLFCSARALLGPCRRWCRGSRRRSA